MLEDEEKRELRREIGQLREQQERDRQATRTKLFWAMWLIPLILIQLGAPDAAIAGGSVGLVGLWFLGFPLAYWFYHKFLTDKSKD